MWVVEYVAYIVVCAGLALLDTHCLTRHPGAFQVSFAGFVAAFALLRACRSEDRRP